MSKAFFLIAFLAILSVSTATQVKQQENNAIKMVGDYMGKLLRNEEVPTLGSFSIFGSIACLSGFTAIMNSGFMLFDMFTYKQFVAEPTAWNIIFHGYTIIFNLFVIQVCGAI